MGKRIPRDRAAGARRWSPQPLGTASREEERWAKALSEAAVSLVFRYVLPEREETPGLRNLVLDALAGHPAFGELVRAAVRRLQ